MFKGFAGGGEVAHERLFGFDGIMLENGAEDAYMLAEAKAGPFAAEVVIAELELDEGIDKAVAACEEAVSGGVKEEMMKGDINLEEGG